MGYLTLSDRFLRASSIHHLSIHPILTVPHTTAWLLQPAFNSGGQSEPGYRAGHVRTFWGTMTQQRYS